MENMTAATGSEPEIVATMVGSSDTTPAIVANNLQKTYREGMISRKKFKALKGVSFSVEQGEIFGLLGPNGAGKTTFIKVLLGIIRKSGGNASMMGFPAGSRKCRSMVGYLPERLRIAPHSRVAKKIWSKSSVKAWCNVWVWPKRCCTIQRC
jgi:ABC-2 type transport system ATP-binding protein